jgi:hypothetical protein
MPPPISRFICFLALKTQLAVVELFSANRFMGDSKAELGTTSSLDECTVLELWTRDLAFE